MNKSEFIKSINMELVDSYRTGEADKYVDYAYQTYVEKVKPYYQLISTWRVGSEEDKCSLNEVRIALGLPRTLFEIYKGIPEFKEIVDLDKNVMSLKAQMDLVEAIEFYKREGKRNAKLIEMQLTRYDDDYKKKDDNSDTGIPSQINIEFKNGSKK